METTADEINEGLARYLWPERNMQIVRFDGHAWMDEVTEYGASTHPVLLFTESLDACEKVADKLGVRDIEMQVEEPGKHWCGVHAWRFADSYGPTRSHALAAALWAAVKETAE